MASFARDHSAERRRAADPLHEERQHEDAQHASVEQRAHLVHGLDQRAEARGEVGEGDRVSIPRTRSRRARRSDNDGPIAPGLKWR